AKPAPGGPLPRAAKSVAANFNLKTLRHDVALLSLAAPTSAPAVTLASPEEDAAAVVPGTPLRVAGWGATDPFGRRLPGFLKETTVTVRDRSLCRRWFAHGLHPGDQICLMGGRIPHRR